MKYSGQAVKLQDCSRKSAGGPSRDDAGVGTDLRAQAKAQSTVKFHTLKYRSLAGIESGKLEQLCINPRTRKTSVMCVADAELAIEIFSAA